MFVNSCLFKTEKCVLYESLHFVSCLQYVFFIFIFFSFRVKLYIAIDTLAVVCSVQYCQKPLLPHVLKKLGFIFLLFFFLSFFHHSTGNEKKVRQCPGLKLQKKKAKHPLKWVCWNDTETALSSEYEDWVYSLPLGHLHHPFMSKHWGK